MITDLHSRRIALIGGAGFIGHNLALTLKQRGAQVDVIDSLQVNNLYSFTSQSAGLQRDVAISILNERLDLLRSHDVALHPQDARDYHALSRILADIKPHVIVHLAAVSHAGRSNKDPYSTFDHSMRTLENALDFARTGGVEHFVFVSSSMVYGNFETQAVAEDHPLNPVGIYGALKVGGEKLVIAYQQVFNLSYTIVRPSALYGPRCVSRRVGQIFVEEALAGRPLTIENEGDERLDFTYIGDLVDGLCLVIVRPEARNQVFNITYGASRSIAELVEVLKRHFPGIAVNQMSRDPLMPVRGTLNIEKARRLLGYEPANPIEVGFEKYIHWYRDRPVGVRR
jgi:nucleoside-diphosphate-sugar epimerase